MTAEAPPREWTVTVPVDGVVAQFMIKGEPVSKARARFTKRGSTTSAYTPEKTFQAEQEVAWQFRAAARGHKPDAESTYGVAAHFHPGTRQRRDIDNMLKLLLDGLNGIAWADDSQVVEISARKTYDLASPGNARTEVVIYRVGEVARRTVHCAYCSTDFAVFPSWNGVDRRFCSYTCAIAWRRERRTRTCAHCSNEFVAAKVAKPPKFCSRACADAARRKTVTCTRCGVEFTIQRCHARASNFCTPECRTAHAREQRARNAKGTCQTCGGPTSKKTYRQCRTCHLNGTNVRGEPRIEAA